MWLYFKFLTIENIRVGMYCIVICQGAQLQKKGEFSNKIITLYWFPNSERRLAEIDWRKSAQTLTSQRETTFLKKADSRCTCYWGPGWDLQEVETFQRRGPLQPVSCRSERKRKRVAGGANCAMGQFFTDGKRTMGKHLKTAKEIEVTGEERPLPPLAPAPLS